MPKGRWMWRLWLPQWLVLGVLLLAGQAYAQVMTLSTANAHIVPQVSKAVQTAVVLPHSWDAAYPYEGGEVIYEVDLPALQQLPRYKGNTLWAIYASRVGNQLQVRLNGQTIAKYGELGEVREDAAKMPLMVVLPTQLLESQKLSIQVSTQFARKGGLSELYVGSESEIKWLYKEQLFWTRTIYWMMGFSMLVLGLIGLAFYVIERRFNQLYFSAMMMFGLINCADHLICDAPVQWQVWQVLMLLVQAYYMLFMSRYVLQAVRLEAAWVQRWFLLLSLVCIVTAVLTVTTTNPYYWNITLLGFGIYGSFALFHVGRKVMRAPKVLNLLLLWVCMLVYATAWRDYSLMHLTSFGFGHVELLPIAMQLFTVFMLISFLQQFSTRSRALRKINLSLEQRIQAREAALAKSFVQQRTQHADQVRLLERERIMQDIHDGVGGQLVSLVNLIKREQASSEPLQTTHLLEHAQLALDELRMAVDSLQPFEGDLSTVLATLRYRFEPRFKAMGIVWIWRVGDLPLLSQLTPKVALHIQKILLEALTNVMQHAYASAIKVSAKARTDPETGAQEVVIAMQDNGVGLGSTQQDELNFAGDATLIGSRATANGMGAGQGLRNMRFRAQAIGAKIAWTPPRANFAKSGTRIVLTLPVVTDDRVS